MFRKVENNMSMIRDVESRGGKTQFRFLEMKNTVCKMKNITAN